MKHSVTIKNAILSLTTTDIITLSVAKKINAMSLSAFGITIKKLRQSAKQHSPF
jgi:hypothetical protein